MELFARDDHLSALPPRVIIIATCMGRLKFLQQALPTWLQNTVFDIIIVDYSCPDGVGDWIQFAGLESRVKVLHQVASRHGGRNVFNLSRARNAGARIAGDGYLLFLDADTELCPGFGEWVTERATRGTAMAVLSPTWPLFGLLGVHSEAFLQAGGYDEGFVGWGGEDVDIRIRLRLCGLNYIAFPENLLKSIPHSGTLRTQNSVETDFNKMREITQAYLDRKLIRLTGRNSAAWYEDPHAGCLDAPAAP